MIPKAKREAKKSALNSYSIRNHKRVRKDKKKGKGKWEKEKTISQHGYGEDNEEMNDWSE